MGDECAALCSRHLFYGQRLNHIIMYMNYRQKLIEKWETYFPGTSLPVGVFYSDELCGAEYLRKP